MPTAGGGCLGRRHTGAPLLRVSLLCPHAPHRALPLRLLHAPPSQPRAAAGSAAGSARGERTAKRFLSLLAITSATSLREKPC